MDWARVGEDDERHQEYPTSSVSTLSYTWPMCIMSVPVSKCALTYVLRMLCFVCLCECESVPCADKEKPRLLGGAGMVGR